MSEMLEVDSEAGPAPSGAPRLPVTAIVASHNEASLLQQCLPSVGFCAEVIVIDIASTDRTAEVAREHGARVVRHPWVPIAEHARMSLVGEAAHEWLLFLDPDETFPPSLAHQLAELLPSLPSDVAVIECPWQFSFRGKQLRGTVWGGINRKRTLVRRGGVELRASVHSGTVARAGYRVEQIPFTGDNAIAHHWAPSYRVLFEKHRRYLRLEGRDGRESGLVTGYRDIVATPWRSFAECFVTRKGFRDRGTGFALSVFWAAYSTAAKIALLRELRRTGAAPS